MNHPDTLLRRIRLLTWIVIAGLFVGGATAIPLQSELNGVVRLLGADQPGAGSISQWLVRVRDALNATYSRYPFIAYGTDWLAFGHFVIALFFFSALKEPVKNIGLFTVGLTTCVLLVPYALLMGELRGIPLGWRLIDCSFGIFGLIPLWFCQHYCKQIKRFGESNRRI